MNNKYLIGLILSLFSFNAFAQNYNFEWASVIKSDEFSSINCTQIDHQGNLISLGNFKGTLTYDALSGDTSSISIGETDLFLQKMTPEGELLWLKTLGSSEHEYASFIDVDQFGNIYVSGTFDGQLDFDPGIGVYNLNGDESDHIFVAKYNNDGAFIWAKQMETIQWGQHKSEVKVDQIGNVYVIGEFRHQVDFDPGIDTFILDAGNNDNLFIQKLNTQGDFQWVKQIEADSYGALHHGNFKPVITEEGDLLIGGTFSDTLDFDPGPSVHNLIGHSGGNIFLLKLNASGDFIWAKQIGDHGQFVNCVDLILDLDDNILLSGLFSDTVDFDPGVGVESLTCDSSYSSFVVKLDHNSEFIWAKDFPMHGGAFSHSHSLASDQFKNVYLALVFDTLQVDSFTFETIGPYNYHDILTMKLNASGQVKWGLSYGGISADFCKGIVVNDLGEIYTSGYFHQTVDFDPSSGVSEFTVDGVMASGNGFIQKLNQCFTTTAETYSLCDSLVWIDGNTYYEDNQSASYIYSTASDCDSIIVLDLDITELSPTISAFGPSIITEQDWDSYQWVDCDNDFEEIPQENSFLFTPTQSGNYAVMVEQDGCTSISECFTYEPLSTQDVLLNQVTILPNPTHGQVTINIGSLDKVGVKVFDVLGKVVYESSEITESKTQLDLIGESGVYMIELSSNTLKRVYRVVKL